MLLKHLKEKTEIELLKELLTNILSYNDSVNSFENKINFGLKNLNVKYIMYGYDDGIKFSEDYYLNKITESIVTVKESTRSDEYSKVTTTFMFPNKDKKSKVNSLKITLNEVNNALIKNEKIENKELFLDKDLKLILNDFLNLENYEENIFNDFKNYLKELMIKNENIDKILELKNNNILIVKEINKNIENKIKTEKTKTKLNDKDFGLSF